jgi:hypothetical protein
LSKKADKFDFISFRSSEEMICVKCGEMFKSRNTKADGPPNDTGEYNDGDQAPRDRDMKKFCIKGGDVKEMESDTVGDTNTFRNRLINSIKGSRERERGRAK